MDQGVGSETARQFMPVAQVYEFVEQHRSAGRLDEAEALLKQLLASEPKACHH